MHRLSSEQPAGTYAPAPTLRSVPPGARLAPGEAEAVMRAILDAAFDCVVVIDAGGHVLEWNGAAETTFGYTREEAVGRTLADLIVPPELREAHRRGLMRQAMGGEATLLGDRIEVPAIRADGSRLMAELAVVKVAGGESAAFA